MVFSLLSLLVSAGTTVVNPTHVESRYVLGSPEPFPNPAPGHATIYVVREQFVRQGHLPCELLYVDDAPAGLLPQQSWFAIRVPPGLHCIWGVRSCPHLGLRFEAGESYLFRLREVIDDRDRRTACWIEDDPGPLHRFVDRIDLPYVLTTEAGFRYMRRVMPPAPQTLDSLRRVPVDPCEPLVFDRILCEKPLDKVNLKTAFSRLNGTLTFEDGVLHYRLTGRIRTSLFGWRVVSDSVDIRPDQFMAIRFGSTRVTSTSPWINIVYRDGTVTRVISFADEREDDAVDTYNRLFRALRALWKASTSKAVENALLR